MQQLSLFIEAITKWIGSVSSLIVHTVFFVLALALGVMHVVDLETILLVVTTVVSLEAIYLAILIQMTVNRNTDSLREVEIDVDEIQKDIDAIEQDVDEIQEDEAAEVARDRQQKAAIDNISQRLQQLLNDIGKLH